jgi:hypothetical protein
MKTMLSCEFPGKVNWKKLVQWLDELDMYVTLSFNCTSRKNFEWWKREINKKTNRISFVAWPVLPKSKGYWYSSFLPSEDLDTLDEFKDIKFKIDLEPPFPGNKFSLLKGIFWGLKYLLKKAPNKEYLQHKIKKISKTGNVTISSFPLPKFILKHFGWAEANEYNYMMYSGFLPKYLRQIYRFFFQFFVKLNKHAYFTIGPIGPGAFGDEPCYENTKEMEKDIIFLKKHRVTKINFFELSAITKRGKKWLEIIKIT